MASYRYRVSRLLPIAYIQTCLLKFILIDDDSCLLLSQVSGFISLILNRQFFCQKIRRNVLICLCIANRYHTNMFKYAARPKKSEVYRDPLYILSLDRNHSSVQDFLVTEFEQAIQ